MKGKSKLIRDVLVSLTKDGGPDAPYVLRTTGAVSVQRVRFDSYREALAQYSAECRRVKNEGAR